MIKHICLLALLSLTSIIFAQSERLTQADVELQQSFIQGTRLLILEKYEDAVKEFEAVLAKDKTNSAAAYELARIYNYLDDKAKAIKFAKSATEYDPSNEWYKMLLGDFYQEANEDDKAAAVYESLVDQHPQDDYYYFKWAYFLVRSNQTEEAIKVYERLEKRIGINEELTRRKHTLYLGLGNYKKAAKELDILIERFPHKTNYRHLLASFYEQIGDNAKAKEVYKQILKISPDDARATLALAGSDQGGGDVRYLRSLKPVFENPNVKIDVKIVELFPYLTKVVENSDLVLADAGIELTNILEKVHPNNAKSYSIAGDFYFHSDRKKEAIDKYKATLEFDENIYLVWEQLLYAYADIKDFKTLVNSSEEALDLFPNQAAIFYLNGLGNSGLQKHKDAISSLRQGLLMAGRIPHLKYDIQVLLGREFYETKDFAKSDKAFEDALKINPKGAEALASYGYHLSLRGENLDKAKDLTTQAIEINSDNPSFLHAKGWVLYKMKDFKGAKNLLEKAIKNGDLDVTTLEHFGDALFQNGEADEAVNYWQQALDKGSKSPNLEKKIEERKLLE
ncbi:MAG: tetratricopeptide repeat protein [Bacteroidetes bacterium]|jgi:tetratricopeptide (TPR) repeat protein|nr:tetratricopeptide repeat protein [Bacteroidota bacterium]MDF1868219.1 tetratricopeptide repeat protein [Saprospiraceae bacterium]